ncbi:helix-turn-helix transcriptional regulator [Mucilaginibacter aquariorum]|uniref:helix-turn-helix transcriptional regulator n=1 Tax=Mucilaginibacter aquariorum TaxID=2967225 RepID=UPI0025B6DF2B|nr:LuxR C-terminal-related transcriptional regulator [Mucilaginibacter aquariorum]
MTLNFWIRNRSVILYGSSLAVLLFLMKWLEWRFIIIDHALELYAGALAIIFTLLGIWLAIKLTRPKTNTIIVEKEVFVKSDEFVLDDKELTRVGLSKRELEVLQLMAQGLSNHQIAEHLFVSLNTIKTHSSKVFEKLEVQRRTQAVDKAKKLCLIP